MFGEQARLRRQAHEQRVDHRCLWTRNGRHWRDREALRQWRSAIAHVLVLVLVLALHHSRSERERESQPTTSAVAAPAAAAINIDFTGSSLMLSLIHI